ncbi:unnamed protein product [Cyberlindnera jadinii]|uniref:Uncharacterized protein n=1 Tax=Cyberlindnera jadinii (strain ATCC 18201 / CBS 1600 / BCRC 20928 / JCM 3617 / NBRC 0987 / NRRL Y-1542) TaxID=983966 RepID=A0A0H5C6N3_CYBJN|nr:unnamed protein product [Cyberlindnera jadinii]
MSKEPSAKDKKITTITTLYDVCDRDRQVKYSTLGPDEVLAKHPRSPSIIPVRHRSHEFKLPDSELLKLYITTLLRNIQVKDCCLTKLHY